MSPEVSIIILVIVALIFDYLNGFHDASNIVATMISSGAASPRAALAMVAGAQFVGPLVFGVAVATTVGKEVVNPESITIGVVLAALGSAIAWNIVTWFLGLPSSSSHALMGGASGKRGCICRFQPSSSCWTDQGGHWLVRHPDSGHDCRLFVLQARALFRTWSPTPHQLGFQAVSSTYGHTPFLVPRVQ